MEKAVSMICVDDCYSTSMPIGSKQLVVSLLLWTAVIATIGGAYWLAVSGTVSLQPTNNRTKIRQFRLDSSHYVVGNNEHDSDTTLLPAIAWLMSFPNSGTSYTLRLVQQLANQTTATNYGKELVDYQTKHSFLVREDWIHGPFRSISSKPLPTHYILTKTHCGGRCVECGPDRYLENYRSFQQACARGDRTPSIQWNQTEPLLQYDPSLVSKAVHLIRNPFDNVVGRFHLARLQAPTPLKYPNNSTGFQRWCRDMDKQHRSMEQHIRWIDDRVRARFRNVPCHAEFFKYVQWHNLATITVTETMKLENMVLYYEDYHEQHLPLLANREKLSTGTSRIPKRQVPHFIPQQVRVLMEFLQVQQPDWNALPLFEQRTYVETYFTLDQRRSVHRLVEELSTVTTWQLLEHYFKH